MAEEPTYTFSSIISLSITEGTRRNGNRPCNSKGCKTCRHMKNTNTFRSTKGPYTRPYKVRTSANCKSRGVVYLIECKKCPEQYVGSTKNALHIRLNGHRYDIGNMKIQKPVAEHFNRRGHSMEDLTIMVIEKIPKRDVQTRRGREKHERKWIGTLHTLDPLGMNR